MALICQKSRSRFGTDMPNRSRFGTDMSNRTRSRFFSDMPVEKEAPPPEKSYMALRVAVLSASELGKPEWLVGDFTLKTAEALGIGLSSEIADTEHSRVYVEIMLGSSLRKTYQAKSEPGACSVKWDQEEHFFNHDGSDNTLEVIVRDHKGIRGMLGADPLIGVGSCLLEESHLSGGSVPVVVQLFTEDGQTPAGKLYIEVQVESASVPYESVTLKEGWLQKRGPTKFYGWNWRWCILETSKRAEGPLDTTMAEQVVGRLRYFADIERKVEKGDITIVSSTCTIRFTHPSAVGDAYKYQRSRPHGFVLDAHPNAGNDRRLYYFDAGSEPELKKWIDAVALVSNGESTVAPRSSIKPARKKHKKAARKAGKGGKGGKVVQKQHFIPLPGNVAGVRAPRKKSW